ncbi:biosynthetic peptidoglycan transglycosylase [Xanthobacter autotrophicus]|uniref:biosynthetic peptidoglycan transglycosylase n=1 Tax=Xanthobacter autotrophicus TaxID=280 RepID=UPI0024A62EBB|nr:biosynthetic peptidoglycan transglycosylase [Xanthobacter autotrophicus]MDI4659252.1 transglycosylase domain-containing protein [Xanthobacter autotrophicus]
MVALVLRVLLALAAIPLVLSIAYNVVNPVSTLMLLRWVEGKRVERVWTPIEQMSPALVRTVIASEDASFCSHWGVDLDEMRAAIDKADELEDARGASTIPMQIAKNLFLWPGRALIRKAFEIPLALWLDLVVSKRRLIEIYLNIAEWGPNGEFGVEAGAGRAFGIPAARVDARQAALLAVMLPNPRRRDAGNPSAGVERLAARLQARVPREGPELTACLGPLR